MNLNEFIERYKGRRVEMDGVSKYACVDLVKAYAKYVLSLEFKAFGNAKDYYNNFKNIPLLYNNFDRIPNTPAFIPARGDIVVWNNGTYGHIAIATGEGTTKWFNSFDQNYGINKKCRIVKHNYKHFLGVLRPRNQTAIYGNKYNVGNIVEIKVPVGIAVQGSPGGKSLVDDGRSQFWIQESEVKDGYIVSRVTIIEANNKEYKVQCLYDRFWVAEKNIKKKLK